MLLKCMTKGRDKGFVSMLHKAERRRAAQRSPGSQKKLAGRRNLEGEGRGSPNTRDEHLTETFAFSCQADIARIVKLIQDCS